MTRQAQPARGSIPAHIWYALLMRCPRCYKGAMWRGPLRMHRTCASCGLAFEREPGYFLGAMYASYFIGVFATMPVWIWLIISDQPVPVFSAVTVAIVLLIWPVAFHYSRPIWIHIDYFVEPWNFQSNAGVPGF
jgi:uncharacterized protein (DUF983 family)